MNVKGFDDTIRWYDENSESYSRAQATKTPIDSIEKFLTYLPQHPRVLDAGCASGRETGVFVQKGADVTGVDLSKGFLKLAREKYPTVRFVEADFRRLPLDDGMFDGVWSHASLVHLEILEDVQKTLAEFRRVLKPSGVLYICVKEQQGDEETAVVTDTLSNHDRFFRYYTEEGLKKLIEDTGFAVLEIARKPDLHGRSEVQWLEIISRRA